MKKSKNAADRVKNLLKEASYKQIRERHHDYIHEKTTPLPAGIQSISVRKVEEGKRRLGKAKVIPQKSSKFSLEQLHCTYNQNYPLFFIEKAEAFQMKNIQNLKVKERMIATRNIKKLSLEIQKWIYSQVHQEVTVLREDTLEFCNLLERREERHYQFDRIIKYLSDT